jgi:phosphoribosyl 1,2-cyclic phosphodiesterase
MRITFWGTRGSITLPGHERVRYGTNTACVSVTAGESTLILDAGQGVVLLGDRIMAARKPKEKLHLHLLLSHLHWDHVIGLPFFMPVFFPTITLEIHGRKAEEVEAATSRLFTSTYSPIKGTENLGATLHYRSLDAPRVEIDGFTVTTCPLRHPAGSLAFRLDHGGRSMVYASDHESGDPDTDAQLVALARGTDVLVHDAQDPVDEPENFPHPGHSSYREAVQCGVRAGAKRVVLFHHHFLSEDETLDQVGLRATAEAAGRLDVIVARDGVILDL